jgi:hypothetical protein
MVRQAAIRKAEIVMSGQSLQLNGASIGRFPGRPENMQR